MPKFQEMMRKYPHALKHMTISLVDACMGVHREAILAVSHRWEDPAQPDGQGVQLETIREFLSERPGIQYLFFDFSSMPQGNRTAAENRAFKAMLPNINLLYMGCTVLVLQDLSYMSRFWTQFEAWLSCQKATASGLVSAPLSERRCTVRCIHNAPADLATNLLTMWGGKTSIEAYEILRKPDVVVTNASDKEAQLPKLLALDRMVAASMSEMLEA